MHATNPHSHVSLATPSEGAGEQCGVMYGRLYEWQKLSEIVDFFVVMDCAPIY
jgi:spore germination protein YaaH